jgi:hypothetical protein
VKPRLLAVASGGLELWLTDNVDNPLRAHGYVSMLGIRLGDTDSTLQSLLTFGAVEWRLVRLPDRARRAKIDVVLRSGPFGCYVAKAAPNATRRGQVRK